MWCVAVVGSIVPSVMRAGFKINMCPFCVWPCAPLVPQTRLRLTVRFALHDVLRSYSVSCLASKLGCLRSMPCVAVACVHTKSRPGEILRAVWLLRA